MLYAPLCLYRELAIEPIGPLDETNPLDLLAGKLLDVLVFVANEPQAPDVTSIREGDMLPIGFQLPSSLLVLDRTVVMLKAGIALLAWLLVFALVIETSNSEPCPISSRLTGLRVETS